MAAAARAPGGGRKPTPTALRIIRGNPARRPLPENEPQGKPKLPKAPAFLSDRAKREWRRIGRQLLGAGIVTDLDAMALAGLVQSYMRWVEAQEGLAQTGLLIRGRDGVPRLNPLLRVSREAQSEYTRLLMEFGLTPSSRSRVQAHKQEEGDPFETFLRGAK